ncbi:MAG TPA: hypothetical protein VFY26_11390 [Anaerolineales bacterium]|nr:hypothetical protein [Anaerolineales bacterium]
MNSKMTAMLILAGTVLAACASPANPAVTPTAFGLPSPTFFPVETSALFTQTPISLTPLPTTAGTTPIATLPATQSSGSTNLCADPRATDLIDSLKTAVLNSDGPLLASLVSPSSGLDVAYFHSGTVVNYRPDQAKFLFETTYEVDWGLEPGSGAPKSGSFHDVVVPALVKMFNQPYTLHCNELKHGGATYPVNFPYDRGYYSIYFAGSEANGNLDWQTWVAGIEYVDGRPYLYALMQFFWEP